MWLACFLATVALLALAFSGRILFGSWLSPASFFSLFWFAGLSASLWLAPDYDLWAGAAWLIFFYALAFWVGAAVAAALWGEFGLRQRDPDGDCFLSRSSFYLLVIIFAVGMATIPMMLASRGYGITDLFSLETISSLARDFSIARYTEDYDPPALIRVLNSLLYAGSLLTGVVWALPSSRLSRAASLISIAPLGLQALIMTARNYLLLAAIFIGAGYLATRVLKRARFRIRRIHLMALMVMVLAGVAFGAGLQVLRDDVSQLDWHTSYLKVRSSALGSPAVFSRWLELHWNEVDPALGAYSIAGVFDFFGWSKRIPGIYSEVIFLGKSSSVSENSNIYTVFRGLIQDLTLPLSLIVFFVAGIAFGIVYYATLNGAIWGVPVLALFYSWVVWGYIASILNYNSIILAFLLFFMLVIGSLRSSPQRTLAGRI